MTTPTDAAPSPATDSSAAPTAPAATPWWRDAVVYQIYIRSFADGDGDGVGDLAGIRAKLPYLAELGVDSIWINPFYPSPMADHGYDVADYRDIEPLFGTLEEADAMIREAHELGLKVILDLVPNHTSDQHAWFQAALAAASGSPERERYLFRPGRGDGSEPPNDWLSLFGGPAWRRVENGEWYLHLFAPEQPDLNWLNPEVREEYHDVLRFWLDRGADGFRIDVAHGLAKDPDLPDLGARAEDILEPNNRLDHPHWDQDEVHEVYRGWRQVLNGYPGDRMLVAEAWVASPERLARYLRPDELHTAFAFDFLKAPWDAAVLREVVDRSLAANAAVGAPTTWVLSNHDVIRQVTRYAGPDLPFDAGTAADTEVDPREGTTAEPAAAPPAGRDLARGLRRARAAALLMLALPGGVYLYQGEELGLPEVEDLPEEVLQDPVWLRSGGTRRGRDGCRVPVPWSASGSSYGFGPDGGAAPWLSQPADWGSYAVDAQQGAPGSTLELYRAGLRIRRQSPALGEGPMRWLDSPRADVLVLARDGEGEGEGVVCAVNLGAEPVRLPAYGELLLSSADLPDLAVLPGESAAWYRTN